MALDRGTRKAAFVHFVELFSMIGTLAGAGLGIYNALGGTPIDLVVSAFKFGFLGFIGGSAVGIVLGLISVILGTIFGRR